LNTTIHVEHTYFYITWMVWYTYWICHH